MLVFYPIDETPGCKAQLCALRDHWHGFTRRGVIVLGINPGDAGSHSRFKQRHGFPFPLLVDRGKTVASLYKSGGLIIRRTVYAIAPDGRIAFAERGAPVPERILAALAE